MQIVVVVLLLPGGETAAGAALAAAVAATVEDPDAAGGSRPSVKTLVIRRPDGSAVPLEAPVAGRTTVLEAGDDESCVDCLHNYFGEQVPDVILFAAGPREADIAGRLAARLDGGFAGDCVGLSVATRPPRLRRLVDGGRMAVEFEPTTGVTVATVLPGVVPPAAQGLPVAEEVLAAVRAAGSVVGQGPGSPAGNAWREAPAVEVDRDLGSARVVVAGGRGVGSRAGFELIERVAELLGGAVAASRPPVEAGWVTGTLKVGQSGRTVAPHVYLAVGISGASQHVIGMHRSKHVVAVNSDRHAPMVELSETAVVAEWSRFGPLLVAELERLRGPGS